MGKLIAAINTTPEGFCGHDQVIADEEHHQFSNDLLRTSETVLFGRVTYQLFESYWPEEAKNSTVPGPVSEFAQLIDNVHKVVFSKTLNNVQWKNTTVADEITSDQITKLKQRTNKNLLILGSPTIVAKLTELELIDEYYFSIQPMIAGNGKRLFEKIHLDKMHNLKHTSTNTFKSGVVTLHYRVAM